MTTMTPSTSIRFNTHFAAFPALRATYSAQLINDEVGKTLVSASTQQDGIANGVRGIDAAVEVGRQIANRANEAGVQKVVFDRSGYRYHGRVAALADAARKEGLEF